MTVRVCIYQTGFVYSEGRTVPYFDVIMSCMYTVQCIYISMLGMPRY